MRSLIATVTGILVSALATTASAETATVLSSLDFSNSLSGATTLGLDITLLPKSAAYGILGAGYLILSVLRRRNNNFRTPKQRV